VGIQMTQIKCLLGGAVFGGVAMTLAILLTSGF
jgi:hypothetical protein